MSPAKGLTLIELLLCIAIAALLLAISSPLANLLSRQRITTATHTLVDSLALARSEAVRRGSAVTLRNSEGYWERGWIIFADHDGDGEIDSGEEILRQQPGLPGTIIRGNTPLRTQITYRSDGATWTPSGAFQAGNLLLCESGPPSVSYRLIISKGGRPRVERLTDGAAGCP